MIISPCISICKTDPSTGYCYGCGRSNEEKRLWKLEETTDDWKKENIIQIEKKGKMSFKESTLVETKNNQINIIREGSLSKKLINEELKNFNKKHY